MRSIGGREERKAKGGENKIKEENRWQFFTSFLKRGLGTRGASLNRFFQRGAQAGMKGVKGRRRAEEEEKEEKVVENEEKEAEGPIFLPSSCAKRRKLYLPPAVSLSSTVVARRPSLDWNLKFRYPRTRRFPLFSPLSSSLDAAASVSASSKRS